MVSFRKINNYRSLQRLTSSLYTPSTPINNPSYLNFFLLYAFSYASLIHPWVPLQKKWDIQPFWLMHSQITLRMPWATSFFQILPIIPVHFLLYLPWVALKWNMIRRLFISPFCLLSAAAAEVIQFIMYQENKMQIWV